MNVYVISSSLDARDRQKALAIPGLKDFIRKPIPAEQFKTLMGI